MKLRTQESRRIIIMSEKLARKEINICKRYIETATMSKSTSILKGVDCLLISSSIIDYNSIISDLDLEIKTGPLLVSKTRSSILIPP